MTTPTPEAQRLAREWPKRCGCGLVYAGPASWGALKLVGHVDDKFGRLELRNCPCGSTLGVVVAVYDLAAEF